MSSPRLSICIHAGPCREGSSEFIPGQNCAHVDPHEFEDGGMAGCGCGRCVFQGVMAECMPVEEQPKLDT